MKPSPFTYHRPETLEEALATLADVGGDGKVLAGGQSLLPLLSMRLAAPAHLVDIGRLRGLAHVTRDDGGVRVGALARHAEVERDAGAAAAQPLLRRALRLVAHPTIRNRGTTVGSIAHADPSGEMTAVLALLRGSVVLASASGRREVAAADFFVGPLESALRPGELALEARFPAAPARSGSAFVELARRHGDYAVCGVGAVVVLDERGAVASARTSYVSMGPVPEVLDLTADAPPSGADLADSAAWRAAGARTAALLEPDADIHATADYRRHLGRVLTARALAEAAGRARAAARAPEPEEALRA
ncbi:FAD binding domain-containing protein [Vallicoccus soli]|uniref:Xanthine dehydrogenase family protein subunit M n=1 Tax=Vallicoccus soli TaxID=2339232 RepID=A0A3A3Z394_9ACTN|nr:FAD binding domain-containing protein [Vallicoccus soli]RJK97174.1 xanthine dehydrogenase family protein subunit M [Vallicoccus soli]